MQSSARRLAYNPRLQSTRIRLLHSVRGNQKTAMAAAQGGKIDARNPNFKPEDFRQRWEHIWSAGVAPGMHWDAAKASPALLDLLASDRIASVEGKRALVPGCGRGYDLVAFAAAGALRSVGLEISPTAVQEGKAYLSETLGEGSTGKAEVLLADFFTWCDPDGPFDIGFDYTFGCAMHPSDRPSWAQSWSDAIKPGGTLIALLWPVDPALDPLVGPPFPVTIELYRELLGPHFELQSVAPVPEALSHSSRRGKEHLALFVRK